MKTTKRTIAVSGGFDPVHIGHTRMFKAARALGDELVVIVNNDNWLRTKKGYVTMPQAERKELIAEMRSVDKVILTTHEANDTDMSVCKALVELRPDVFANGGDRGEENTPERALCERLGIDMMYNVGDGGKIQSSSWMIRDAANALKRNDRPWGWFENHHSAPGVHVKTLHVLPGKRLSLQRHQYRNETWILMSGDAQAIAGPSIDELDEYELSINEPFYVKAGVMHRLASRKGGALVEISFGQFDENDIERFEDDFGRVAP